MAEYSFDIVCKVNQLELSNAVDMTLKEVENRFDFKGSPVTLKLEKDAIQMEASDDMRMKQLIDVFQSRMVKRNLSLKAFKFGKFDTNVSGKVKCKVDVQNGLTAEQCKKVSALIRDSKLKVQSRIQGDAVRVTGKSKDDLQDVQKLLRETELDFETSYDNYR